MEFDDDGLDDGPVAPLLPPDDRLWRHPSEVASAGSTQPPGSGLRRHREPRMLTVVALTSSISVLLTLGVVAIVRPVRTQVAVEQIAAPTGEGSPKAADAPDVASIADRLRSSITSISAEAADGARRGSGVVYRTDGLVLTAHHVVDGASKVTVVLDDGRELHARVVGGDPDTDIAVLDLEGDHFAVAPLGSASAIKVGQAAITIGTPPEGAHAPVVTVGVVSATNQAVNAAGRRLIEMIQTDAAVAPGSAGGAVVDGAGVVIGIATINVERDGNASGYATPVDVARLVAAQLLTHGKVTRGWLGIEGDDLSAGRAKELGVGSGVVVRGLKGSSPAQQSDLRPGDVLLEIDGETIRSMSALVIELRTRRPGDMVAITYLRDEQRRVAKVTLGEKPSH